MADDDTQFIKRAAVVYGRRSSNNPLHLSVEEQTLSSEAARSDIVASQLLRSAPSLDASGTERSPSPDTVIPFQFGFKHKLKELDEQFDDHRTQSLPGQSSDNRAIFKDVQTVSMGTSMLSSEASRSSADLSHESLSPSLTSSRATSVQEQTPDSPSVRRQTRRVSNHIPVDSEAEDPSSSSSASPVRHPITTPHSRSSPTPPTSGEIPMASRKSKGKASARDVLPLVFDGERPSAANIPSRAKKGRRSDPLVRAKTKAPTKKEQREAAFESSRIAAGRSVEVARTQEQRHSLSAFFASLRKDNIAAPALGTELLSDPIERFSSPTDKLTRELPLNTASGTATGLRRASTDIGTINRPSSSRTLTVLPPASADSDDEMPSIASIIHQADQKHWKLQAIKQVALEHANTDKMIVNGSDDDDDLLIVKDDMHSIARQEATERRLGKAHGTPTKDRTSSRMFNHPSIRPVATSPCKLSEQELQELAKPSFARMGKRAKSQLSKRQLDQLMITKHTEEQLKSIKRQEEEWVKRGGKLSRDVDGGAPHNSLPQTLDAYAEQGLKAVEMIDGPGDAASADESDNDYSPSRQGSASPKPVGGSDLRDDNMEVSPVPLPPGDDQDDDDDEFIALKHNKYGQRRPRVVESDDEEMQPVQSGLPTVQRDSASSMESQTEDENDKENSAKLMYDRSEDKENKVIVRHEPTVSVSRLGPLHDFEDATERSGSLASVTDDPTGSPKGDARLPLKEISKDENDFCLSSSLFTNRLQSEPLSPPCTSASTLSLGLSPVLLSERSNRIYRLSLDSENNENVPPGSEAFQPSFLERLQSQASLEPSLASLNPAPNGGFSQFFSVEDQNLKKFVDRAENEGLSLTLDVGLKPALEVSNSLRQKAETIFEKEQEYVVAAAVQQNDRPKEVLYVNDHGFLTQTRPEDSSPQIYRISSSLTTKFTGTQVYSPQTQSLTTRPPLRTLSFTSSQELSPDPQPLGRLRRRSVSPSEEKIPGHNRNPVTKLNAFSILGNPPMLQSKLLANKYENSEFVAVEAEESDEDDMFGFGGPKEEEEEEDNDQDKVVEGLVDDALMDAETEAVDLVQEKFREYEEEDDRQLQKLHEDATKGKFRIKRRDRGVGFEDDSDGDDGDDDERRIRQRIHKKRKIQDDSLEALGQSEETRAFYDTYHQDLVDEDDEFGYLRVDTSTPQDDGDAQDEEPQEIVSVDEIRKRAREMAQNNHEVEVLDPEDTSWVDRAMIIEADDTVCVKVVDCRWSKSARRPNAGQVDFDEERSTRRAASEQERKQMTSWAQNQSRYRHQGTGRSGNSTAVTGHAKARSGGGSLRSTQLKSATVNTTRKTKTPNLLSNVSDRSGKFA